MTDTQWLPVASDSLRTVRDHGSFDRLAAAVPAAFLSENGAEVGGTPDEDAVLSLVFDGLAEVHDGTLTDIDRVLDAWNPSRVPSSLLGPLSATLGMSLEPALGPKPQRALVANATRIYSNKGNQTGITILAEAASGSDVRVQRGKNLLPSANTSGYSNADLLTTRLAQPVAEADNEITVKSVSGWPLQFTATGALRQPIWLVIDSGAFIEAMLVTGANGTRLTVDRGSNTFGRFGMPRADHAVDAEVRIEVTWHGWTMGPGYEMRILSRGDVGFDMPTTSLTEQPPDVSHTLEITRVSSNDVVSPVLGFGGLRYVAAYSRRGSVGYVTTRHEHGLVPGQKVACAFGAASAPPAGVYTYSVGSVLNEHTFTVQHTEDGLSDVDMSTEEFASGVNPTVYAAPHPVSMVAVAEGETYTYSYSTRAVTLTRTSNGYIKYYDSIGNLLATFNGTPEFDDSTLWKRLEVFGTAPTGAVLAEVGVTWENEWNLFEVHYVTQHQFEVGSAATSYDDGGLIRIGINSQAATDPRSVVRSRISALMKDYGTERTFRTQFLNTSLAFTGAGTALLSQTSDGVDTVDWAAKDLDIRVRMRNDRTAEGTYLTAFREFFRVFYGDTFAPSGDDKYFQILGNGTAFQIGHTFNSGVTVVSQTSAAHGILPGETFWFRLVRTTAGVVSFYKAVDSQTEPTDWVLISTHTGFTTTGAVTTRNVSLGGAWLGRIFYARLLTSPTAVHSTLDPTKYDSLTDHITQADEWPVKFWTLTDTSTLVVTEFP